MESVTWGYWSTGTVQYCFAGGPAEQRSYLLTFFRALSQSPGNGARRSVTFRLTDSQMTLPDTDGVVVVPGIYEIFPQQEVWVAYCRGSWSVSVSNRGIEVELTEVGWQNHWDVLNQALTQALVIDTQLKTNLVSFHAACVELQWGNVLLFGSSMSGKSTLAIGAAARSATMVSDDRVFVSTRSPSNIYVLGSPITFRGG